MKHGDTLELPNCKSQCGQNESQFESWQRPLTACVTKFELGEAADYRHFQCFQLTRNSFFLVNHWQDHGCPELTDACGEQRLAHVVPSNRWATVAQITKKEVLIESCQNTQCITVSCLWVCMTTGQSRCPYWPLFTAESTNNGRNRTTAQWNKVIWSDQANFLLHQIAALPCLPGEHLAPWCTMGRRQAIRKSQRSRDGVLNGSGVYCYWEKE